jgi:hypothetical protein
VPPGESAPDQPVKSFPVSHIMSGHRVSVQKRKIDECHVATESVVDGEPAPTVADPVSVVAAISDNVDPNSMAPAVHKKALLVLTDVLRKLFDAHGDVKCTNESIACSRFELQEVQVLATHFRVLQSINKKRRRKGEIFHEIWSRSFIR